MGLLCQFIQDKLNLGGRGADEVGLNLVSTGTAGPPKELPGPLLGPGGPGNVQSTSSGWLKGWGLWPLGPVRSPLYHLQRASQCQSGDSSSKWPTGRGF